MKRGSLRSRVFGVLGLLALAGCGEAAGPTGTAGGSLGVVTPGLPGGIPLPSGSPAAGAATTRAIQSGAAAVDLRPGDMQPFTSPPPIAPGPGTASTGWALGPTALLPPAKSLGGCFTAVGPSLGGYASEYLYNPAAGGDEGHGAIVPAAGGADEGHGAIVIAVLKTATIAAAAQAAVTTDAYQRCYAAEVRRALVADATATAPVTLTGATTSTVEAVSPGVAAVVYRYATPYSRGGAHVSYNTTAWLQQGSYSVIFEVWTSDAATPVTDVSTDLVLLAQRLQTAPQPV